MEMHAGMYLQELSPDRHITRWVDGEKKGCRFEPEVKAITASQLALQGSPGSAKVSLDSVVTTMWQTALDMNNKYKETSEGGLAASIPINVSEC